MLSSRPFAFEEDPKYRLAKTPATTKHRKENAAHHVPLTSRRVVRPLGDKTPFPNRVQFVNDALSPPSKNLKASLIESAQSLLQSENRNSDPDSAQRPSSARKNYPRSPKTNFGGQNKFKTPANKGNPWAALFDDIADAGAESQVHEIVVQENDYDEIEYMPPNTLDLPYQPPFDFDLPNYKEMGENILKFSNSFPPDDPPLPDIDITEEDIGPLSWDLLSLPDLEDEDDPFHNVDPLTNTTAVESLPSRPVTSAAVHRRGVSMSRGLKGKELSSTALAVPPQPKRPATSMYSYQLRDRMRRTTTAGVQVRKSSINTAAAARGTLGALHRSAIPTPAKRMGVGVGTQAKTRTGPIETLRGRNRDEGKAKRDSKLTEVEVGLLSLCVVENVSGKKRLEELRTMVNDFMFEV